MKIKFAFVLLILVLTNSCKDNEILIPRPLANLRVEFPERVYTETSLSCPYQFGLASYMTPNPTSSENPCHLDISLGQFNGMLHLSYVPVKDNLPELVAYSIDKVREHQVKASAIQDSLIISQEHRVYGTFYEFYGNSATPFQFHFTDSLQHFIRGTVYFNATPNFDSIYPVLQYVREDLIHIITSNRWQ